MSEAEGGVQDTANDSVDIQTAVGRILSGSVPVRAPAPQPAVQPRAAAPAPQPAVQPRAAAPAPQPAVNPNVIELQEPPPDIIGLESGVKPEEIVTPAVRSDAQPAGDDIVAPPETHNNTRAKTAWELVRKENRDLKASLEAARTQARELAQQAEQAAAAKTEREAELEKRNAELENEIGRHSLRSTQAFRQKYLQPIEQELSKAVSALVKAGQSPEDAKALVQRMLKTDIQNQDMDAVLGDLPRFAQGVVANSLFNAQNLEQQAREAESSWKQTHAALEADTAKLHETKLKRELVTDTVGAAEELSEKYGSWVFSPDPSNADWMQQREKLVLEAQGVLKNGSNRDLARAVLEGTAASFYRRYAEMLREQLDAAKSELAARDAARPSIGNGGQMRAPAAAPVARKPVGLDEGIGEAFRQFSGAQGAPIQR